MHTSLQSDKSSNKQQCKCKLPKHIVYDTIFRRGNHRNTYSGHIVDKISMDWDYYYWNIIYTDFIIYKHINYRLNCNDTKINVT